MDIILAALAHPVAQREVLSHVRLHHAFPPLLVHA